MTNSIISDIKPLNGINLQNDYLGISLTELIVEQKKKEQKELSQNNVRYVEKNIQPISKDEDFVEQSVHKERDIKGEKCQNLVQIKLKNKIKVYNLTVDKDNVYFCN